MEVLKNGRYPFRCSLVKELHTLVGAGNLTEFAKLINMAYPTVHGWKMNGIPEFQIRKLQRMKIRLKREKAERLKAKKAETEVKFVKHPAAELPRFISGADRMTIIRIVSDSVLDEEEKLRVIKALTN